MEADDGGRRPRVRVGLLIDPARFILGAWLCAHDGRQQVAEYLLDRGAEVNWIPP